MRETIIDLGNLKIDGNLYRDAQIGIFPNPKDETWEVASTVPARGMLKPAYGTWMQATVAAESLAGVLRKYRHTA